LSVQTFLATLPVKNVEVHGYDSDNFKVCIYSINNRDTIK